MVSPAEPRDLLAERIRRLEARLVAVGEDLVATRRDLGQATALLDALVDLVGRLTRVVDVQGTSLHGEETVLERKVGSLEGRITELVGSLSVALEHLEAIHARLEPAAETQRR